MIMKERVALITGATRGIGKAIAIELAQQGCHIGFTYHKNHEKALALTAELSSYGIQAFGKAVDIADAQASQGFVEEVQCKFEKIDYLVNNAGITNDGLLATMPMSAITEVIQTNLIGTMMMTQAVIQHMLRRREGGIVNITSSAASKPGKGQSNYAAAKGGLESFTKALAVELAPRNIRVNAVAPGVIATDMTKALLEVAQADIYQRLLIKQPGRSQDISRAVSFLLSSENQYITGQILSVDGGMKMA